MKFGPHYLPILMYHQILPKSNPHFSKHIAVSPENFREQVQYLIDHGFNIKTVKEYFSHAEPFSQEKCALLTFDDVSSSFVEYGKPILDSLKVKGSVFPIKNMCFDQKYFNLSNEGISPLAENDLRLLHAEGFELGSHGLSHRNLHKISFDEVKQELSESKTWLDGLTGGSTQTVCYPIGGIDKDIVEFAKSIGYINGLSTLKGSLQFEQDRMSLRRVDIKNNVVGKKLGSHISPFYGFRRFITRPFRAKYRVDFRHPDLAR